MLRPTDLALLEPAAPAPQRPKRVIPPEEAARHAPKRPRCGETHHRAVLPDSAVRRLREQRQRYGKSYTHLAEEFGCHWATVRDIVKGRTRISAGGPVERDETKLDDQARMLLIAKHLYEGGTLTAQWVMAHTGVSNPTAKRDVTKVLEVLPVQNMRPARRGMERQLRLKGGGGAGEGE